MLCISEITKTFGGVAALQGSTFTVRSREVTALIGPNGAGKTTLFDIISGFIKPDSGGIRFDSRDILALSPYARARRGISRTFQRVRLFENLTVLDHLFMAEGSVDARFWKNFFYTPKVDEEAFGLVLREYGINSSLYALVSDLSYGQRKLLELAMAIRRPHTMLLLDEPVAGVNSLVQEKIEKLLIDLKAKGETILLIDHDMGFVRRLADHVVALDAGIVVAEGEPNTVLADPRVLEAYLGD